MCDGAQNDLRSREEEGEKEKEKTIPKSLSIRQRIPFGCTAATQTAAV